MCNWTRSSLSTLQLSQGHRDSQRLRRMPPHPHTDSCYSRSAKEDRVQTANNSMRLISGAFRIAPWDPLPEILNILLIRHGLDMLMRNSALRLSRLPRASQLVQSGEG